MKQIGFIYLLTAVLAFTSSAQTFTYDFAAGYDGWTGDFADYPPSDSVLYELAFSRTTLPAPLNTSKQALMITGKNHSDDLFMFLKKKITGLLPNTTYTIKIEIECASRAPTNGFGVGGAPGEGVILKAGATLIEPVKVVQEDHYRMNINKANQGLPGPDMDTIGHVGVADTTTVFAFINRSNAGHLFTLTTNASGEAWICIGSDSGFEATTTLYYSKITLTFTSGITGIKDPQKESGLALFPNPGKEKLILKADRRWHNAPYIVTDLSGKVILTGKLNAEETLIHTAAWAPGIYLCYLPLSKAPALKWVKQ